MTPVGYRSLRLVGFKYLYLLYDFDVKGVIVDICIDSALNVIECLLSVPGKKKFDEFREAKSSSSDYI